jgi:hypothetical protein
MHDNWRLQPRTTIAIAAALLVYAAPAASDDEQPIHEPNRRLAAGALVRAEEPETSEESWLRKFHLKKKRGFEYTHGFTLGSGKKIIFNLQGPIIRKKTPGLVFEIRF